MEISRKSFHYRVTMFLYRHQPADGLAIEPHTICGYFWWILFSPFFFIMFNFGKFFIIMLIFPFVVIWNAISWMWSHTPLAKLPEPVFLQVTAEYISATHRRVCPLIEFYDESHESVAG